MTLANTLAEARRALLDLSTRNRLLALPSTARARGVIRFADEDADFVVAQLAAGKAFGFEAAGTVEAGAQPKRGRAKAEGVAAASATATREQWQRDTNLRSAMSPEELSRRLRDVLNDARTAREESGVASLFLAVGALTWFDPGTPGTARSAPLALIPATLEREGVSNRYRLRANPEEVVENLSLREKLAVEFRIALPEFGEYDPTRWAEAVSGVVGGREGWGVDADALALGLFAFSKFLMWRDLDPATHPGLLAQPLLRRLLDPVPPPPEPPPFADDADVDAEIPVERLDHVLEVDGSQALAVEAARRGHSLVIQGPPGTGKSQTIVNILAQAIMDGRSVLFVAEKAAALEVVKRRLESLGLGAAVLELHSEKTSKRAVLDELRATLALPPPAPRAREEAIQRLGDLRGRLNRHAAAMRARVGASGLVAQEVVARLAELRASGEAPPPFTLNAAGWDGAKLRALRDAARELGERAAGAASPWRGVRAELDALAADRLLAELPRALRVIAAAPGTIAEARAALAAEALRTQAPMRAEELPAARARLADLRVVEAAQRDARFLPGALEVPGLAEARATLAKPGGLLGFLDGGRRAAQARLASALRDPADAAALDALLAAQAARARLGASGDAAALERDIAWMEANAAALATLPPSDAQRAALAAWAPIAEATGYAFDGPWSALAETLAAWAGAPEALADWQGWARAVAAAPELAPLAAALEEGRLPPERAVTAFDFALHESLLRVLFREQPSLAAFDGDAANRLVEDFRLADAARVRLARSEAAAIHAARVKALRDGEEASSLAFLRGEFERKRGHAPVRTILTRAAPLIRKAKPVLMMSPLTVAQFLANPHHATQPGFPLFDLLVMDEASQIEPVDALGAIARAKQVVVVGDDRQMPPTRFFQRMTEDAEEAPSDEEQAPGARDVESILGLANARGIPRMMLRWHYRSRHESLIATSNREFYEERLLVLPSPRPRSATLGLSLVRVDGRFAGSANLVEAEAVAQAVLRHAREAPADSLGVAAFSVTQRDAILEAVERLRRDSPDTEAFFTAHPAEPFFVKNLENVQGDERDAIMISVGYGRGADGKLAMRFGPLSNDGGERRLNVLITRAKKRCIVFSGIGAEEVDTERAKGRGVAALKTFLAFAAGGEARRVTGREASPIAALIGAIVAESGREPVTRVGLSGLFLDVAARGAEGFDLGVELDAMDWAQLRCARDRDRGRQMALEGMGWRLARSWSLDWLNRPDAARAALRQALGVEAPAAATPATAPDTGLATPYAETVWDKPPRTRAEWTDMMLAILRTEAPLHRDALLERAKLLTAAAFNPSEAQGALREAQLLHGALEEAGFWRLEDTPLPTPRDRRAAAPYLRRAAMVPPAEIEAAARALLALQPRASEEELAAGVVRLLGLDANAPPAIAARLAVLAAQGRLIA
jgi:DNA polymerase III delta prime subunit